MRSCGGIARPDPSIPAIRLVDVGDGSGSLDHPKPELPLCPGMAWHLKATSKRQGTICALPRLPMAAERAELRPNWENQR
jgi:hypothetical protein